MQERFIDVPVQWTCESEEETHAASTEGKRSVPRISAMTKNRRKNSIARRLCRAMERHFAIFARLASN